MTYLVVIYVSLCLMYVDAQCPDCPEANIINTKYKDDAEEFFTIEIETDQNLIPNLHNLFIKDAFPKGQQINKNDKVIISHTFPAGTTLCIRSVMVETKLANETNLRLFQGSTVLPFQEGMTPATKWKKTDFDLGNPVSGVTGIELDFFAPAGELKIKNIFIDACVETKWCDWTPYTPCTKTCGPGKKTRSRICNCPNPKPTRFTCQGDDTETVDCNFECCKVDGKWRLWSIWSDCSVSCGGGIKERTRTCRYPDPTCKGQPCPGSDTKTMECNTDCCRVDGYFSQWSQWGTCSVSCGGGERERRRECVFDDPTCRGKGCRGRRRHVQTCNTDCCPVDGSWTMWTTWSVCTKSCGSGDRLRERLCKDPEPACNGLDCDGLAIDSESCNTQCCPVDGIWTKWTEWSVCPVTCGGSTQTRTRSCTNPPPECSGDDCPGHSSETKACAEDCCPVGAFWLTWGAWSPCTLTCGIGEQSRTRLCVEDPCTKEGCPNHDTETQTCNENCCPVPTYWTSWTAWGQCTETCGGGDQYRFRECIDYSAPYCEEDCDISNPDLQLQECNTHCCPVDSEWTLWTSWSSCVVTCGEATKTRTRTCTESSCPGETCFGPPSQTIGCNLDCCKVDAVWETWSAWGACPVTCGGDTQIRLRECTYPEPECKGDDCIGDDTDTQDCNTQCCRFDGSWTKWTGWSECTVTCEGGSQERSRNCSYPDPTCKGEDCGPDDTETQICNTNCCPIDGYWSTWSGWSACSKTCEGGRQRKTRTCIYPDPTCKGRSCGAFDTTVQDCNTQCCPVDGVWSKWEPWGDCPVTCGGDIRSRTRSCLFPDPCHGDFCPGGDLDTEACNVNCCPVDGIWETWGGWGDCGKTCGFATQMRVRKCIYPVDDCRGQDCGDDDSQEQNCLLPCCPVDGLWTKWSDWTPCTKSCGGGEQERSRDCVTDEGGLYDDVPLECQGLPCTGNPTEKQDCNTDCCPEPPSWGMWNNWSPCSVTCGIGTKRRTRRCEAAPCDDGTRCKPGRSDQVVDCNEPCCEETLDYNNIGGLEVNYFGTEDEAKNEPNRFLQGSGKKLFITSTDDFSDYFEVIFTEPKTIVDFGLETIYAAGVIVTLETADGEKVVTSDVPPGNIGGAAPDPHSFSAAIGEWTDVTKVTVEFDYGGTGGEIKASSLFFTVCIEPEKKTCGLSGGVCTLCAHCRKPNRFYQCFNAKNQCPGNNFCCCYTRKLNINRREKCGNP